MRRGLAVHASSRQTWRIADKPPHDPFSIPPDAQAELELELADPLPLEPRSSIPVAREVEAPQGGTSLSGRESLPSRGSSVAGGTSSHDFRGDKSFAEHQAETRQRFWLATRIPLILLLAWFTYSHLSLKGQWVFIDNVNLLFHEAGHVLFSWGGQTLHSAGGTLGQLMWPFGLGIYFALKRKDYMAAGACAWWFGENWVGIARYMNDAIAQELPLVGGNQHDWTYLLSHWGVLNKCGVYADRTRFWGLAIMIAALVFMAYRVWRPSDEDLASGFRADE